MRRVGLMAKNNAFVAHQMVASHLDHKFKHSGGFVNALQAAKDLAMPPPSLVGNYIVIDSNATEGLVGQTSSAYHLLAAAEADLRRFVDFQTHQLQGLLDRAHARTSQAQAMAAEAALVYETPLSVTFLSNLTNVQDADHQPMEVKLQEKVTKHPNP
jgi:hypothetical protein